MATKKSAEKKPTIIRVIEGGGKGFRRTDVCERKIGDITIPNECISDLPALIKFAGAGMLSGTKAIAYCTAGAIDDDNYIAVSPNIPFLANTNLGIHTNGAHGLPAFVFNDMHGSVTGMCQIFPKLTYFAGITWSSGIGIRICKNGEIVSDSEGGHLCIDHSPFAQLCGCKQRGCAEAICAGKGVGRRLVAELETRGITVPPNMSLFEFLDGSYLSGQNWAVDAYRMIATGMGLYLTMLQDLLHLPAIVWKGTFARKALALPGIENAIRDTMRQHLMNRAWEKDLVFYQVPGPPELVDDGESFLGAAQLALERL